MFLAPETRVPFAWAAGAFLLALGAVVRWRIDLVRQFRQLASA